jgi:hypothetical protein
VTFRWGYAVAAVALFAIEVLIALFAHDAFVRPLVGDALAVVFVYAIFRALLKLEVRGATVAALAVAFVIEALQGLRLVDRLGIDPRGVVGIVLGSTFDWRDLGAYTVGAVGVLAVEKLRVARARR